MITVFPHSKVQINYGRCSLKIKGGDHLFRNVFLKTCSKIMLFDKFG
jgi:hypothetical protein